ncbi:hypothetical protein [Nocardia cyriacigeorgica]|uniref:hypothetical protein n=1 Tax=Nocardia cyriacigeorgica TaxID=135487 RepID=UPI0024561943|nr:hypothetical protein [Nocardia cyriacigeorgica]
MIRMTAEEVRTTADRMATRIAARVGRPVNDTMRREMAEAVIAQFDRSAPRAAFQLRRELGFI